MNYSEIRSINVNTHIEKKNGLSFYLGLGQSINYCYSIVMPLGNTESPEGLEKL